MFKSVLGLFALLSGLNPVVQQDAEKWLQSRMQNGLYEVESLENSWVHSNETNGAYNISSEKVNPNVSENGIDHGKPLVPCTNELCITPSPIPHPTIQPFPRVSPLPLPSVFPEPTTHPSFAPLPSVSPCEYELCPIVPPCEKRHDCFIVDPIDPPVEYDQVSHGQTQPRIDPPTLDISRQ